MSKVAEDRYEVLKILQNAGIHPALWSEDVLAYYGVPTVCFELYILVPDFALEEATSLLVNAPGYMQTGPDENEMSMNLPRQYFLKYWKHRFMRLGCSEATGIQLLPAQEFANFTISEETSVLERGLLYPKLTHFVESLVFQYSRSATTKAESHYRTLVGLHLSYIAEYVRQKVDTAKLSPRAAQVYKLLTIENTKQNKDDLLNYY